MATMKLTVRRRWWVTPFFGAVHGAAVAAAYLGVPERIALERWGNWAARIIARRGLRFETEG